MFEGGQPLYHYLVLGYLLPDGSQVPILHHPTCKLEVHNQKSRDSPWGHGRWWGGEVWPPPCSNPNEINSRKFWHVHSILNLFKYGLIPLTIIFCDKIRPYYVRRKETKDTVGRYIVLIPEMKADSCQQDRKWWCILGTYTYFRDGWRSDQHWKCFRLW